MLGIFKNQSQPNGFSFGWENIFFLRMLLRECPRMATESTWKRDKEMLFRRGFILFGVFWFVKAGCQNGMQIRLGLSRLWAFSVTFSIPLSRMWQENLMGCQIVFPSPCETRVFPGTSVRGRKYASLVEVGFTFCQCQDALWFVVVKANLSGETLIISNPPLFNKSLTSYLRLLILRLDAGEPSKKFSYKMELNSKKEISCVGRFSR